MKTSLLFFAGNQRIDTVISIQYKIERAIIGFEGFVKEYLLQFYEVWSMILKYNKILSSVIHAQLPMIG